MFRASRSQGEACVRGVFRPTREDGGLDRGHGVGRARLVGRQAGQILGGAIRCAGVVGCSIRWQRRCDHQSTGRAVVLVSSRRCNCLLRFVRW